ncbi:MAG: ROK family protein [Actinomycetota bacterium]|nr:ROK family protein [Actinomycetota bacterium]
MTSRVGFGIDIGGSGMKAAPVNLSESGQLVAERFRIPTPHPAKPEAVADVVVDLVRHFEWEGPIGISLPSVVRNGIVHSADNIDESCIDVDAESLFSSLLKHDVVVMNDADAAGVAEMSFGAGAGRRGVVITLTFGTGIGSALFVDGHLVPNSELGHLEFRGESFERWAAASARKREDLTWRKWARRVSRYLQTVDALFSPDVIIVGGGASKSAEKWVPLLEVRPEIVVAEFANTAGIVGAAMSSIRT